MFYEVGPRTMSPRLASLASGTSPDTPTEYRGRTTIRMIEQVTARDLSAAHSQTISTHVHDLIPGGCHTYAKGDDQYPSCAPRVIARGKGCHVWDPAGNEYIEYGMGLRAVTLGHAYPQVVEAAYREMLRGTNFIRPSPIEAECAEELLELIDPDAMVKFGKNGSDVTTAAAKLARAHTGRDLVAICADQPFFSVDDWFIGTTAMSAGIPEAIREMTVSFRYNDPASLQHLFESHPGRIACVMLEAATNTEPLPGFLERVRELCTRYGAVLIFDEMITGFRWHARGAQYVYGVKPDLSTFGKGMANGFSVSALVGRREIMELGGLRHDRPRVFLLSTTHGGETSSLAACRATMGVYREQPVIETMELRGAELEHAMNDLARDLGIEKSFHVIGRPNNLIYVTADADGNRSQAHRALFMQEMIKRGVIGPSFVISYSHTKEDVERTVEAGRAALAVYARALEDGVERYLEGPPVKPVFRQFN